MAGMRNSPDTEEALGQSESFLLFQERLSKVAPVDRPVLLIGERGTGKELAASRLHYLSARWDGPFIALNCSALTSTLIASELFGYEKGAFTGAERRHIGRFEAADEGTLFLDEIGSIPMEVQEKILRVVEYGAFERLGSSRAVEVNVRIIGATNADLPQLVREGKFKADLLDRLSFEVLILPPLRERTGDVRLLARHFATRMAFELGWDTLPELTDELMETLESHYWPGNIRELKNVIERAVFRSGGNPVSFAEFDPFHPDERSVSSVNIKKEHEVAKKTGVPDTSMDTIKLLPYPEAMKKLEIHYIRKALAETKFNRKKAARIMGISYDKMRRLIQKYENDLETREDVR